MSKGRKNEKQRAGAQEVRKEWSVGTCGCGDEAVVQRRAEVDGVRIEQGEHCRAHDLHKPVRVLW